MASASTVPNLYQGVEKGSFGYKMLATMGWKEGQGLGANKQGIIEHVKVKKKQDALGVGAAEHVHKLRDWTTGMVGFDTILTGLKEVSRAPHSSSSSDHDSSSSECHESGYASDSDTSAEVKTNSSKTAAAGVVGLKCGDSNADLPLNKKQKVLDELAASDSVSKKKAKKPNSNKKQKKVAATPAAAGKPRKMSNQTASTAAAAAAASNASDISSSQSDSDPDLDSPKSPGAAAAAVPPSTSRIKAATHLGRYQKREKAKTVRNYSATDLAAILGLPGSAPGAHTAEGAAGWAAAAAGISNPSGAAAAASSSSSSDDSNSSDGSQSDQDSSELRLRPTTPPGSDTPPVRILVNQQHQQRQGLGSGSSDHPDPDPAAAAGVAGTGISGSWWRSVFVRADRAAGSAGWAVGKNLINVSGFLEEDQTNLYMQAHEAAVKNKQGLGRSAMPKKVAGARWQGKKTKLGSDSEDEQQQQDKEQQQQQHEEEAAVAAAGRESYTQNGITIVMPIRYGQQQQQQIGGDQQQQQQRGTRKQQRKQERDSSSSGVKRKRKSDQQQVAAESDKPAAAAAALAGHSRRKKQKISDQQQQVQHTAGKPPPAAAAAADCSKVKWAQLAARILEGAPKKRMRVQKLHQKVVAAAGYDVDAPGVDSEKLHQQMLKKLRKAEGLAVCDKYVAMA